MSRVLKNLSKAIAEGLSLFGKIISTILLALYATFLTATSIFIVLDSLNVPANIVTLISSMVSIVLFFLLAGIGLSHILHVKEPRKLWDYVDVAGALILFIAFFSLIPMGLFMGFLEALIKYFRILFVDERVFNGMVLLNTVGFWIVIYASYEKAKRKPPN